MPVINQNGAFVSDLASGRHLAIHPLPPAIARDLWSLLDDAGCRPFLMTFDGAFDRLYYNDAILRNDGMRRFLHDRQRMHDPRLASLDHLSHGLKDQVVCLTAINTLPRVRDLEREMRRRHGGSIDLHCHKEYDPHWYILAVHDARATKDQGVVSIQRVRNLADCRLVVFGDQVNDIGMFRTADEAYAVAGGAPELAEHATAIIGSNDDDAVARWLEMHAGAGRLTRIGTRGKPTRPTTLLDDHIFAEMTANDAIHRGGGMRLELACPTDVLRSAGSGSRRTVVPRRGTARTSRRLRRRSTEPSA